MASIREFEKPAPPPSKPAVAASFRSSFRSKPKEKAASEAPYSSTPATSTAAAAAAERRLGGRVYGLREFPGKEAAALGGAFRDNVRRLLRQWETAAAVEEEPSAWRALLVDEHSGTLVPVFVVEELAAASSTPLCDYCRCTGWSHHWVSKRRHHIIIPGDANWDRPLGADAVRRGDHLLHGLLHSNGFGHLITLRGRDGGSSFLSGSDIMDIWDRLCSALRVRAVSVEDLTRKRSLDLRLLLGVAHGETWFARWGYFLLKGSFGVSHPAYAAALDAIANLAVDLLRSRHVRRVVTTYRRLSDKPLATVREFLRCLLDWKHRERPPSPPAKVPRFLLPKPTMMKKLKRPYREFDELVDSLPSRWSKQRLRSAAEVIVDKLLEHGSGGQMTRQEVRDAARSGIGDTGLLDFVIKSIGDTIVGQHIVRRLPHPVTRVLHFSLEEHEEPMEEQSPLVESEANQAPQAPRWPSTAEVERDVRAVYRAMMEARHEAAQTLLDCKHWVKWWSLGDESDDLLRFLVEWRPKSWEAAELTRPMPPGEVVVVPPHASIGELLAEAEQALRDTYCFLEGFHAEAMDGIAGEECDPVMLGGTESGDTIGVRGNGADMATWLRYQGGADTWEVRCVCTARDDDGERMVACDACDVWNHTRCVGIPDTDPVPPLFLCVLCGGALMAAGQIIEDGKAA